MAAKLVFYFNQASRGWTETWYSSRDYNSYEIDDNDIIAYCTKRLKFLETPGIIYAVRASATELPRLSKLLLLGKRYVAGNVNSQQLARGEPDPVTTDAVINFTNQAGVKKNLFLRGLPDAMVVRDGFGNDTPPPDFVGALIEFVNTIRLRNFLIRVANKPPAVGFAPLSIIDVSTDPANPHQSVIRLRSAPNFPLPAPSQARFTRIDTDNLPGFPKIAQVLAQSAVAPFSITIPYRIRNTSPQTPPNMQMIPLGYQYFNWTTGTFVRYSEHKTGRSFGALRGRARSLVRAQ